MGILAIKILNYLKGWTIMRIKNKKKMHSNYFNFKYFVNQFCKSRVNEK